jgi:hypothetical protein
MLCKSPAPPFGRRVDFGNRGNVLGATGDSANRCYFSFGLVDPNKAIRDKFPGFDRRGIDFEWEVYL